MTPTFVFRHRLGTRQQQLTLQVWAVFRIPKTPTPATGLWPARPNLAAGSLSSPGTSATADEVVFPAAYTLYALEAKLGSRVDGFGVSA